MMLLSKIKNYKLILKNTGYLSIIEVIRLLMPFIALPYIIKTIGAENYGTIVFVQAIIAYLLIIINFGLEISAVKHVAANKNDIMKLNTIVSSVFFVKLFLLLISFLLLCIGFFAFDFVRNNLILFLFAFLACISELLFPIWFFQGIQKMKYITIIRTTSIFFYTIAIFLFIKEDQDYIYVALLQSLSVIFSGLIAMYFLYRHEKIRISFPGYNNIRQTFTDSLPFFASRISIVLNSNMAKTLSGIFFSMEAVAAFELAQKISSMAIIPMQMLNQSVYPHIANTLNKKFVNKFLLINVSVSILSGIAVYVLSPFFIWYFAKNELSEAVVLSRILALFVTFAGITTYLGTSVLVSFGHTKIFNLSVIFSTLVLCLLYGALAGLNMFSIYNFAFILVAAELFIMLLRLCFCFKYDILSFKELSIRNLFIRA